MKLYNLARLAQSGNLDGRAGILSSNRWNHEGTPCIYTCTSRSRCVIERSPSGENVPGLVFTIYEVPENSIIEFQENDLPADWNAWPRPVSAREFGDEQLKANEALLLSYPSAVFSEERIYVINTAHPLMEAVKIITRESAG